MFKKQIGIALMIAVGLLLVVSLIGLAVVLTSGTESGQLFNSKDNQPLFGMLAGSTERPKSSPPSPFARPFFPTRPSYLSDLAVFYVSRWATE